MNQKLRQHVALMALKVTEPLKWYVRTSTVLDEARKERITRATELLHNAVLATLEREEEQQKDAHVTDPRLREGYRRLREHTKHCPVIQAHLRVAPAELRIAAEPILAELFAPPPQEQERSRLRS
jgi:hypothetical protein